MKRMMVWLVLLGSFAASVPVGTRADGDIHVKMIEAFGKARDEIHDVLKVMTQEVVELKENQKGGVRRASEFGEAPPGCARVHHRS